MENTELNFLIEFYMCYKSNIDTGKWMMDDLLDELISSYELWDYDREKLKIELLSVSMHILDIDKK